MKPRSPDPNARIEDAIEELASFGLNEEKLSEYFELKRKHLEEFRGEGIGPEPQGKTTWQDECKHLRQFIRMRGRELRPRHIYEIQPFYTEILSSSQLNQERLVFDAAQLTQEREARRQALPEPLHVRVAADDWGTGCFWGAEDEKTLTRGYEYVPSTSNITIKFKWGCRGSYKVYSDDGWWVCSEAGASIKLRVHWLQFSGSAVDSGGADEVVFDLHGDNISEKGWFNVPIEVWTTRHSPWPDEMMLIELSMTFRCYANSGYAEALLDFEGTNWVNFFPLFVVE